MPTGSHLANRKKTSETILCEKVDRCTKFSASCLIRLKTPFCFRCHGFSGTLIFTTGLQINKDEVTCVYYAL